MALILIIDDDELVRAALVLLLERNGHDVIEAGDGKKALAIIRARRPDLVVTDIIMPEMEGVETVREMRRVAPDMKIIAISGGSPLGSANGLELASMLGADAAFAKPIDRDEFLATISRLLAAP